MIVAQGRRTTNNTQGAEGQVDDSAMCVMGNRELAMAAVYFCDTVLWTVVVAGSAGSLTGVTFCVAGVKSYNLILRNFITLLAILKAC